MQKYFTSDQTFVENYLSSMEEIYGKRQHSETQHSGRTNFQRDRDRVIHCEHFRKLEHKTQFFMKTEDGYYRTKLTHSLEAAQIARSICKRFGLCDNLAESITLAKNLGSPPFGVVTEKKLDTLLKEHSNGKIGFCSIIQSLRITMFIEKRYLDFDGLNLTRGTIDGLVKSAKASLLERKEEFNLQILSEYCEQHNINEKHFPSLETQVSLIADKIAMSMHDLDDGLKSHALNINELTDIPIVGETFINLQKKYPSAEIERLIHETLRKSMNQIIEEVCVQFTQNINSMNITSPKDVMLSDKYTVYFSDKLEACLKTMHEVLSNNVYNHHKILRVVKKAETIVEDVFYYFMKHSECLPLHLRKQIQDEESKLYILSDYISSLTDKALIHEWEDCFRLNTL